MDRAGVTDADLKAVYVADEVRPDAARVLAVAEAKTVTIGAGEPLHHGCRRAGSSEATVGEVGVGQEVATRAGNLGVRAADYHPPQTGTGVPGLPNPWHDWPLRPSRVDWLKDQGSIPRAVSVGVNLHLNHRGDIRTASLLHIGAIAHRGDVAEQGTSEVVGTNPVLATIRAASATTRLHLEAADPKWRGSRAVDVSVGGGVLVEGSPAEACFGGGADHNRADRASRRAASGRAGGCRRAGGWSGAGSASRSAGGQALDRQVVADALVIYPHADLGWAGGGRSRVEAVALSLVGASIDRIEATDSGGKEHWGIVAQVAQREGVRPG